MVMPLVGSPRLYGGPSISSRLEKQMHSLGEASEDMSLPALKKNHKARSAEFEKIFSDVLEKYESLKTKVEKSRKGHDDHKRMFEIMKDLQPAAFKLRDAVDSAEMMTADEMWPLPKYREMLLSHSLT